MALEIRIERIHLAYLFITIGILAGIGYAIAAPQNPGHPWSQIDCVGCITSANLGNNAVTTAKILDGQVTAADIANGAVTDAKISGVSWGKVTGVPADIGNGAIKGQPIYQKPPYCGGGLTTNAKCYTVTCPSGAYYDDCSTNYCYGGHTVQCDTTLIGYLITL